MLPLPVLGSVRSWTQSAAGIATPSQWPAAPEAQAAKAMPVLKGSVSQCSSRRSNIVISRSSGVQMSGWYFLYTCM